MDSCSHKNFICTSPSKFYSMKKYSYSYCIIALKAIWSLTELMCYMEKYLWCVWQFKLYSFSCNPPGSKGVESKKKKTTHTYTHTHTYFCLLFFNFILFTSFLFFLFFCICITIAQWKGIDIAWSQQGKLRIKKPGGAPPKQEYPSAEEPAICINEGLLPSSSDTVSWFHMPSLTGCSRLQMVVTFFKWINWSVDGAFYRHLSVISNITCSRGQLWSISYLSDITLWSDTLW